MSKKGTCDVCEEENVEITRGDYCGIETWSCADPEDYEPCTDRANAHGCTCWLPVASATAIDPPEPRIDRNCPLHGRNSDCRLYDEYRDRMAEEMAEEAGHRRQDAKRKGEWGK